mmetsp:Transcript_32801/g.73713  ORF Transcript_32801/g.73713 Transcript_32801/m.73713 type:complete len:209 (-) Transcript_32801:167-793(-)
MSHETTSTSPRPDKNARDALPAWKPISRTRRIWRWEATKLRMKAVWTSLLSPSAANLSGSSSLPCPSSPCPSSSSASFLCSRPLQASASISSPARNHSAFSSGSSPPPCSSNSTCTVVPRATAACVVSVGSGATKDSSSSCFPADSAACSMLSRQTCAGHSPMSTSSRRRRTRPAEGPMRRCTMANSIAMPSPAHARPSLPSANVRTC